MIALYSTGDGRGGAGVLVYQADMLTYFTDTLDGKQESEDGFLYDVMNDLEAFKF